MANVAHLTPTSETSAEPRRICDTELRQRLLELIAECAEENRAAFRRFYDLTSHRVFGIVLAVLQNRAAAEEVAQEVYVQIWRQAGRFNHENANPVGWISSIARNRAIDRLRADRTRGFVQFSDDVPDIGITFNENAPTKTNPLGVKGAGEAGATGAPPALVNAVVDALKDHGVVHVDMPLTPEKIWRAIRDAA